MKYNFDLRKGPIKIEWMKGAKTNMSYNCLDRNVENGHGEKVAFHWVGNDPTDKGSVTYSQLLAEVCKFANVLESRGVKRGKRRIGLNHGGVMLMLIVVKLREREGQGVDPGGSLKGHLWMVDGGYPFPDALH